MNNKMVFILMISFSCGWSLVPLKGDFQDYGQVEFEKIVPSG
jgi:hypothetical protein